MTAQTQPSESTAALRSQLTWGYPAGIPEGVTAAWGCRAIMDGHTGHLDLVHDRQSHAFFVGKSEKQMERIIKALNKALPTIRKRVAKKVKDWTISGRVAEEHVLHKTKVLTVIGNTNASHDYLYMVAFLTPKEG